MSTTCPANEAVERVHMSAIGRVLAPAVLDTVLEAAPSWSRQRKLPRRFMLLFCVLMNLYSEEALPHVFARLVWHGAGAAVESVSAGALCQARYRLGARPLVALFRLVCRPLATPLTPGAFLFGRHLLAVDSTKLDVPDTAANVAAFGRHHAWRGTSGLAAGPPGPLGRMWDPRHL